jgi:hypothetical protein
MNKVLYVGLDVHADTIAVAVADEGPAATTSERSSPTSGLGLPG